MEYAQERMKDLMRAYDEYISSCRHIRMPDVYAAIVNMEARRFWVSDTRAAKVIYAMSRGAPPKGMRPLKREMYEEILRRVLAMRKERPELTVRACCSIVVAGPAPKFYLKPGSAKVMVCKARKEWVQQKLKRLRLSECTAK